MAIPVDSNLFFTGWTDEHTGFLVAFVLMILPAVYQAVRKEWRKKK